MRPGFYKGNKVVEVLKNGGPIHPYDEHFRFGIQKAKLLLAALTIIREFAANTADDGTTTVASQVVRDEATGCQICVWVEMHPEFEHSSGVTIDKPWLQIEAIPLGSGAHIGLGVQKAKAICAVARQLRTWLA